MATIGAAVGVAAYKLIFKKRFNEGELEEVVIDEDKVRMAEAVEVEVSEDEMTELTELIKEAQKQGIRKIFLEVRRSNQGAQHLYHKCGFEKVGERKNFYRFPQEDAILMAYEMR